MQLSLDSFNGVSRCLCKQIQVLVNQLIEVTLLVVIAAYVSECVGVFDYRLKVTHLFRVLRT